MDRRGEDLEERMLDFAALVGKVVDAIPETRLGRHIADQLVRSGISPAPSYAEACATELCNIVGKSIVTAKGNQQKPNQQ